MQFVTIEGAGVCVTKIKTTTEGTLQFVTIEEGICNKNQNHSKIICYEILFSLFLYSGCLANIYEQCFPQAP